MKIKKFNEFEINESWRKIKSYLRYPTAIIDVLFSKVLNYIPLLNFRYDELSANIDNNMNLGKPSEIDIEIKKISLSDIKSTKMKMSLMKSGLLKSWNIYYISTFSSDDRVNSYNNDRDKIYLSKDELRKGDKVMKDRVSDILFFNKKDKNKYSKDELPEVFILVTLRTSKHDDMEKERNDYHQDKEHSEYSKKLDNVIKYSKLKKDDDEYPSMFYIYTNYGITNFLLHDLIKRDYTDLVQKYLDNCDSDEDRRELINMHISSNGGNISKRRNYDTKMSFDLTKSDKMRNILIRFLSKENRSEYMKRNNMDLTMNALRKINEE